MTQPDSLSIVIQKIPENVIKYPSETYSYKLMAKHANDINFDKVSTSYQIDVIINHECYKV